MTFESATPRALDIGCGRNKRPGSLGIDSNPAAVADVRADIDRSGLPFRGSAFDTVYLIHLIEHVFDAVATLEEVHRVTRPGGIVIIETPHYTDFSSFCDPTHRRHLNSFSFRCFTEEGGFSYYTQRRMREKRVCVKLLRFWRFLGFEFAVNHSRAFRKFWEHYLCFVVRGKAMTFELEVLKQPRTAMLSSEK